MLQHVQIQIICDDDYETQTAYQANGYFNQTRNNIILTNIQINSGLVPKITRKTNCQRTRTCHNGRH